MIVVGCEHGCLVDLMLSIPHDHMKDKQMVLSIQLHYINTSWQDSLEQIGTGKLMSNLWLVLVSLVQFGLLSKLDKTGTRTSLHRLKDLKKLDWTNINWFSAVLVSFYDGKTNLNWLTTSLGPVSEVLTLIKHVCNWLNIPLWAWYYPPARSASISLSHGKPSVSSRRSSLNSNKSMCVTCDSSQAAML